MSAIRYSFGGDEHVFVEIDEEMSLEAFFKGMAICNANCEKRRIDGVSEICPANASYQVRFDPDVIQPGQDAGDAEGDRGGRSATPSSNCRRASSRSRCSTTIPGRTRR